MSAETLITAMVVQILYNKDYKDYKDSVQSEEGAAPGALGATHSV